MEKKEEGKKKKKKKKEKKKKMKKRKKKRKQNRDLTLELIFFDGEEAFHEWTKEDST